MKINLPNIKKDIHSRCDDLLSDIVKEKEFKTKFKYGWWMSPGGDTFVYAIGSIGKGKHIVYLNAITGDSIGFNVMTKDLELVDNNDAYGSWQPKTSWNEIPDETIKEKIRSMLRKATRSIKRDMK